MSAGAGDTGERMFGDATEVLKKIAQENGKPKAERIPGLEDGPKYGWKV